MSEVTTTLTILILIVPGFVATGIFTYSLGFRYREFYTTTVWSLAFTAFIYVLMYYLHLFLVSIHSFVTFESVEKLRYLILTSSSDATSKANSGVTFLEIMLILSGGSVFGVVLGYIFSLIVKSDTFSVILNFFTGHSYHLDAWSEFYARPISNNLLVNLKDGRSILGVLVLASETRDEMGIVLCDYAEFTADDHAKKNPIRIKARNARILIMGDNILSITQIPSPAAPQLPKLKSWVKR